MTSEEINERVKSINKYIDDMFVDYGYFSGFSYVKCLNRIADNSLLEFTKILWKCALCNTGTINFDAESTIGMNDLELIMESISTRVRIVFVNSKNYGLYKHALNLFINVVLDLYDSDGQVIKVKCRRPECFNERIFEILKMDEWKDLRDDPDSYENNPVAYLFRNEFIEWFKKYPEWMFEKFNLKYMDVKDWTLDQWKAFYFDFMKLYLNTPKTELPEEFRTEYGITLDEDVLEAENQWIPEKKGRKEKNCIVKMIDCETNEVIERFGCRADVIEVMGIKKNYLSMCLKSVKDFPKSQSKWKRWIHKEENKKYWFVEEEI